MIEALAVARELQIVCCTYLWEGEEEKGGSIMVLIADYIQLTIYRY